MEKNLTRGKIFPLLFSFLIPVVLGLLLQQVYSLADTAIVGRTLGVTALGGVGSTGSLSFLVIGFCNGLCSGFALPVAQAFGAQTSLDAAGYQELLRSLEGVFFAHGEALQPW